ncbi:unnamed protein product [Rotaria magnacalcarata]|uniref:DNA helicase n=1 Tax=Rotaria magnacalcarata TaxID=392030 RepID=A0A819KEM1_9BILA|nr:unnamed protein product [Rotaria magnacalcarata]
MLQYDCFTSRSFWCSSGIVSNELWEIITLRTFKDHFLISIENYVQAKIMKVRLSEKDIDEEESDGKEYYNDCIRIKVSIFVELSIPFHEDQEDETKETEEQIILNRRDEHLHQIITEAETNIKIDPILIPSCYEIDGNNPEDDSQELFQMLSLVNQSTIKAYSASLSGHEQSYLFDPLEAIDKPTRFESLNHYKNLSNKNFCWIADDFNTFMVADSHHGTMSKQWKEDIENRKDQARSVTSEIPTSPFKMNIAAVPPVTTTIAISLPTKSDVIRKFTLNSQQQFAFMIITGHLDDDNQFHTGTISNQLLMCVAGCGGTGKSQLIRAITNYFQMTKRGTMLRKVAPTSIAAAEIDGLTIHSFLGESRKSSKRRQNRTFRPGGTKLENEWRHVKIVKTAKHINMDAPFGGVNVIFFGDYLQYSPVLDKPLYHSHALAQQYNECQIEMQCAQKIISQINCVVELNQQMRTEDARYLELLTRLRDGKSTLEDY